MNTISFWILSSAIIMLIGIIGFLLRERFTSILNKLTELVEAINNVMKVLSVQDEKNKVVDDRITGISAKVKDIEEQVIEIRVNCAKCQKK